MASVLAIYEFDCSGEGSEVYFIGRDRNQASICFNNSQAIIDKSEKLGKSFIVRRDKVMRRRLDHRHNLWMEDRTSVMKPLSKDSRSTDGLNPHCAIFDEVAQYDDPKANRGDYKWNDVEKKSNQDKHHNSINESNQ